MQSLNTIFIIDDDAAILEFVAETLRDEGYIVRTATDGADALALILDQPPSLILLDLLMPTMNGIQFVEELRGRGLASVPVVVMTAIRKTDALIVQDVVDYLFKPFNLDDLCACVNRHLTLERSRPV